MISGLHHLMKLSPEDRAAAFQRADEGVIELIAEMKEQARRSRIPLECNLTDLLRWNRQRAHCLLVVRHPHRSDAAFKVSASGDEREALYLPRSQTNVRPQTSQSFLLAVIPRWLHLKTLILSNPPADLPGGNWTTAERNEWRDLHAVHHRINHEIECVVRKLRRPVLRREYLSRNRNDVA